MTFLKQNWFKIFLPVFIIGVVLFYPNITDAHRSGCHRWHSCPSDSGSYTCGDAGHPCQYPTYPSSGGVIYPPSGYYKDCYDCPLKEVPDNAHTSGIGWSCDSGYIQVGDSCVKPPTPKPTIVPTPTPNTSANILTEVQGNQITYYKNPHWFRERLINNLTAEFGSQYRDIISRLVYTLLPDVKN
ncbi:MAG: hypothetical protein HYS78_01595 [Parcubacteria group bacterium]|nr:hypothetical protein [Parcubacteria group bacterium]